MHCPAHGLGLHFSPPGAPPTLSMAQVPTSSPRDRQPLPQRCPSRAALQLPTALPCPDMGLAKPGPPVGPPSSPAPAPERCLMPGAAAGFPAPGMGQALAARPCPAGSPGEPSPLPVPDPEGPTSLRGALIMGMFINNIFIKKKKKNQVGFFLA